MKVTSVAAALGVGLDGFIDMLDEGTLINTIKAMAHHENGEPQPCADKQYHTALLLL